MGQVAVSALTALGLYPGISIDEVVARLEVMRGRPIYVAVDYAYTWVTEATTGVMVEHETHFCIWLLPGLSPLHQIHVVGHELGHILLGHQCSGESPLRYVGRRKGLRRVLARFGSSPGEVAAEEIAYAITSMAISPVTPSAFEKVFD